MQKILGIDIGSWSVKAVIIAAHNDTYTLVDFFEQEIVRSSDMASEKSCYIQAVQSILQKITSKFDIVYAALGSQFTVMKRFEFHNVRRKDRHKLIENEFDDLGIFSMNDSSIEYLSIKYDSKQAVVLGVLLKKQAANELIDILEACHLTARIIDIDCIAYLNIIPFLQGTITDPSLKNALLETPSYQDKSKKTFAADRVSHRGAELILDIGHKKTTMTHIENNLVLHTRVLNMAGDYITKNLENQLNIPYQEAQVAKHSLAGLTAKGGSNKVESLVLNLYVELCQEVRRTLKSLNAKEFTDITRILVTGGSSQMPGVCHLIQSQTGIPTSKLEVEHKNFRMGQISTDFFEKFSQSLAIALRGDHGKNNSKMNIRHGELALTSNYEKITNELLSYGKMIAIVLFCLLGSYLLRYGFYENQIAAIKMDFRKDVISLFNKEPRELKLITSQKNWDFSQYGERANKMLLQTLQEKKDFISEINSSKEPIVLSLLNEVSLAVPKSIYFEVAEFKVQSNTLFIEAETNTSEAVQSIVSKLKGIKILTQLQVKSQQKKAGSHGQLIRFTMTASILNQGGV